MLTAWQPFFQSDDRMRARACLNAGEVQRLEPGEDQLIRAEVRDGEETHEVTICRDGKHAAAECTCPHFESGSYCKHIYATLLDVQQNDGPGASLMDLMKLRVRAPKARKREGDESSISRSSEPEWMGRMTLLRPAADDMDRLAADVVPTQRQICYVILPEASMRRQTIVVELRQRTPGASGWSKMRQMKINADTVANLPDPLDRELCALLLGGAQYDSYSTADAFPVGRLHSAFLLPPGAWRTLLKRMIDTGQCFVDLDEEAQASQEQPLRWDAAGLWKLWMVGKETEGDLEVNVQLRKDDNIMPVEQPAVLLGGPEGVVIWDDHAAGFDDRDAYRWAVQFRDEYHKTGEPRPLVVPKADVERFLDRLYRLPQIPEIDLPEGIGRIPRHVDPVPHLDLFSPDSTQAGSLLPASAKNQLLAKVWFDYDGQRVSPGQPGRFVTISSAASLITSDDPLAPEASDTDAAGNATSELEPQTDAQQQAESDVIVAEADEPETADLLEDSDDDTPPAHGLLIRRNHRTERDALAILAGQGLRPLSSAGVDTLALPAKQMQAAVSALLARGWEVSADQQTVRHAGAPSFSVASGIDWFELHGGIRYQRDDGEEQEISLPEILAAVRAGKQMITLGDGSQGLLPQQWLQEHGLLTALGKIERDHLRFKSSQAALLDALLDDKELVSVDDTFAQLREQLRHFTGIDEIEADPQFKGSLRPYQRMGLGWMAFLRWFGVGGILADDMGLGKTIQVLSMLQGRHRPVDADDKPDTANRPSIVIAPRSVVFNWVDEARKFTPELRILAYAGAERQTLRDSFEDQDIIVTSFGLLRRDIDELRDFEFDYVILDEAQAIKNPVSQASKAVRLLQSQHRLALTGTPVENHLGDLWSIFEFLNPGMLGSSNRFGELVRASTNLEDDAKANTVQQIAQSLRPFVLRRTKKQVLDDLPEKTEQTIVCEMDPAQRAIYDDLRKYYRSNLFDRLEGGGDSSVVGGKAGFMVLEALLRLRQASCHPALINEDHAEAPSAKLDALLERLADIIEEDSKALVFSQFTSMLSLVRKKLEERGIRYCYLDGQTRDRREVVQRFQSDPKIPVFLISLKTGGFGLNLTAAEYVFILDPWWNPAVEAQAIDRTHRIGQTRKVFAYRLICEDTVEQRIIDLQDRKRAIADAIVGGEGNVLQSLTKDDLEQLLS